MADTYPLTTDHLTAENVPGLVIMMMMIIADLISFLAALVRITVRNRWITVRNRQITVRNRCHFRIWAQIVTFETFAWNDLK